MSALFLTVVFSLYLAQPIRCFTTNDDSLQDDNHPRDPADDTRWLPVYVQAEDNEAEFFFHRTDDVDTLNMIAYDFANRFGLSAGVTCGDDKNCVQKVFVETMQHFSLNSPINIGGGGKSGLRDKAEADRNNLLNKNADSFGSDVWADVPCVPPYCSFQCAKIDYKQTTYMSEFEKDRIALEKYGVFENNARICPNGIIHPIGFAIPEESIVSCVPFKSRRFATTKVASGNYEFKATEEQEYRRQMRSAFYAFTKKKMGWDAMRHYEILASGTAPYFANLSNCPDSYLPKLPKQLILELMSLTGLNGVADINVDDVQVSSFLEGKENLGKSTFDTERYYYLMDSLLRVTRHTLTTKALALDILRIVSDSLSEKEKEKDDDEKRNQNQIEKKLHVIQDTIDRNIDIDIVSKTKPHNDFHFRSRGKQIQKVLFLNGDATNTDYQKDVVLHGLKAVLGEGVVDYAHTRHMYRPRNHVSTEESRQRLHGFGFAISGYMVEESKKLNSSGNHHHHRQGEQESSSSKREQYHSKPQLSVKDRIESREFDMIVYGSVRRGMPFKDVVFNNYPPNRIVFIEGEDIYSNYQQERMFSATASKLIGKGHYFLREMPEKGCPEAF